MLGVELVALPKGITKHLVLKAILGCERTQALTDAVYPAFCLLVREFYFRHYRVCSFNKDTVPARTSPRGTERRRYNAVIASLPR